MKKSIELTVDQAKGLVGQNAALDIILKANFTGTELGLRPQDLFGSFDDILAFHNETADQFAERTKNDTVDERGYKKCKMIVFAMNGGKHVTKGYYPWFNSAGSGSGFSYDDCGYDYGHSFVGSRLLFEESSNAIYAGKTFLTEYGEHING
jgi:hypothetical protein